MMQERQLKQWLNQTYCGKIKFVEPARGSTIGMPDVEVPVGDMILPVELKIGSVGVRGHVFLDIRPSQMHYHIMAAESGQHTAVMYAIGTACKFDVFAFEGRYCENYGYRGHSILLATDQRYTTWGDCGLLDKTFRKMMGMQP